MTLRFRLTFWNTVMLALVLAIFALAFHTFVANTLYNQLEATIRSQAEQVVQIFQSGIDPSRSAPANHHSVIPGVGADNDGHW